jgi:soluble lytic murein transglycosylase-like protein
VGAPPAAAVPEADVRPQARQPGAAAPVGGGAGDGGRAQAARGADAADDAAAFRLPDGPALPAGTLLGFYREAERRFGVDWQVLAAVNFVETGFNRLRSRSSAGAQGPMQFMPATWRAYGLGGDVHDPRDAILGAANYLRASGAARDLRGALGRYNHSERYVDAVAAFAAQMRRDETIFFQYHAWQVFVKTRSGPRRITSP